MEIVITLFIIGLLATGAAVLLARNGFVPRPLAGAWGKTEAPAIRPDEVQNLPVGQAPEWEDRGEVHLPIPSNNSPSDLASVARGVPTGFDTATMPAGIDVERLERIESRLEDLFRAGASNLEKLSGEIARVREELSLRAEAEEARREAAQERMRADILAIVSLVAAERHAGGSVRRLEVSADLYGQLARFEASLASVTNPILLPGEPYEPPTEMTPESLVWENWNEVGDRVFALAETYSSQRLHLSTQTRADVGDFITTLRTLLTRSIYPNLQVDSGPERRAALKRALETIAAELPRVRDVLETEYLEGRSG